MRRQKVKRRIDRFFDECDALYEMVEPLGSVSAQEFARLLHVTKQYRAICRKLAPDVKVDDKVRLRRRKTQIELEHENVWRLMDLGAYGTAKQYIQKMETRYGKDSTNVLWNREDSFALGSRDESQNQNEQ